MSVAMVQWMAPLAAGGAAVELGDWGAGWGVYVWCAVAVLSLLLTALYSGGEIGLYSLSKVRQRLRIHKQEPNALVLAGWLQRPTYVLEGLLVLQNVASFGFAAAVTGILSSYELSEMWQAVISTALITPMILIFAEIMPKDLFHTYADRWTYRLVPLMKWSFRVATVVPVLPVVNLLSRLSMRVVNRNKPEAEIAGPRSEMLMLFQESAATGLLSGTQQDLVQRALRLARISVREVMIPWARVVGVPATISEAGFRALVRRYNVSRMPVLGRSTSEVLGSVEVVDALEPAKVFKVTDHAHPMMTLIGEQSVRSAITLMQKARQTLAVVVDRQGRAIGLVTMKDLIEELVGDLENW
jgi:putative hemolysin